MADITAQMVKELRERTGAGMMDCKAALAETGGDMEKGVDLLRKKGLAKAAKKAGRVAAEGLIGAAVSATKGVVVEVNSETDFVARNDLFQGLVKMIADIALTAGAGGGGMLGITGTAPAAAWVAGAWVVVPWVVVPWVVVPFAAGLSWAAEGAACAGATAGAAAAAPASAPPTAARTSVTDFMASRPPIAKIVSGSSRGVGIWAISGSSSAPSADLVRPGSVAEARHWLRRRPARAAHFEPGHPAGRRGVRRVR